MNQLERMPGQDLIEMNNYKMTVVDIQDLRVGKVIIEKLAGSIPEADCNKATEADPKPQ